jgi:hypothetical protein
MALHKFCDEMCLCWFKHCQKMPVLKFHFYITLSTRALLKKDLLMLALKTPLHQRPFVPQGVADAVSDTTMLL